MGLSGRMIQSNIQDKNNYITVLDVNGKGILKVLFWKHENSPYVPPTKLVIDGEEMHISTFLDSYISGEKKHNGQEIFTINHNTGYIYVLENGVSYNSGKINKGQCILNIPFNNNLKIKCSSSSYGYQWDYPTAVTIGASYVVEV